MGEKKLKPRRASLRRAIQHLNELHHMVEGDEDVISAQTIYNSIYKRKVTNYGPSHKVILDLDEIEALWGPK